MSKPLKVINLYKRDWQEAFTLRRGAVICPYCGDEVRLYRPWGIVYQGSWERTIHNCPKCRMPMLSPNRRKRDIPDAVCVLRSA